MTHIIITAPFQNLTPVKLFGFPKGLIILLKHCMNKKILKFDLFDFV